MEQHLLDLIKALVAKFGPSFASDVEGIVNELIAAVEAKINEAVAGEPK